MATLFETLRPLLRALMRVLFRVEVRGLAYFHAAGPRVLIIANHVSLLDGVLLALFLPKVPTFAINSEIARKPLFRPLVRCVQHLELDVTKPLAVKTLTHRLRENRHIVIFPEGRVTVTNALMKIYEGPGLMADRAAATVLPIGIEGAQFSFFSYLRGVLRRRLLPPIRLTILPPLTLQLPPELSGTARRKLAARQIETALLQTAYANAFRPHSLWRALRYAATLHGGGTVIAEDADHQRLTYRQLITRALLLADPLAGQAAARGETVGLLLPNSLALLASFFALHSRGAVPVMLNYTHGAEKFAACVRLARLKRIISSHRFVEKAKLQAVLDPLAGQVEVLYLEDLASQLTWTQKCRALLSAYFSSTQRVPPGATAVILFTSGSEGAPKAVALSHANLLANRAQVRTLIGLHGGDVIFHALPMFHAFGLLAALLALCEGARTVVYPTPLHYRLIPELCYERNATVLFSTNTFLRAYARVAHPLDFQRLRFVIAGAEKLQREVAEKYWHKFGVRVLEGYGVTEASPVLAVNTPTHHLPGSVGRLISGVAARLLPVPGMARGGRLHVRGPNIMQGYLQSDATLLAPASECGAGWYDTGDIAEIDGGGFVHIIGRVKRFAKVAGEMVSLTEVEDLVSALLPDLNHAALSRADARRGEQIVLITESPTLTRELLKAAARERAASVLIVPRRVYHLAKLPLLASGKVDYPALTAWLLTQTDAPA